MGMKISISGAKESVLALSKDHKNIVDKADKAIHDAGFFIEAEVKDSIAGRRAEKRSVDTGRFLGSIRTDNSKRLESSVGSDVEYSPYLEYGTSRIKARRHFRNTVARNKDKVKDFVHKAIK